MPDPHEQHSLDPQNQTACDFLRSDRLAKLCENAIPFTDVTSFCQTECKALYKVYGCNSAHIFIFDDAGSFSHGGSFGDEGYERSDSESLLKLNASIGRIPLLMKTREPLIQYLDDPDPQDVPLNEKEFLAAAANKAVSILIAADEKIFGICALLYADAKRFSQEDIQEFKNIGNVLGAFALQAKYAWNTVELEVLRERKRLGKEIHDNVSQLVSLITMKASSAAAAFNEGNKDAVIADINSIYDVSNQVFKVLREEILYLGETVENGKGLDCAIREQLERFRGFWGIGVCLDADMFSPDAVVSMQTEMQLTRILHEALTNTARHAQAGNVFVKLEDDGTHLRMIVKDDGCGFDPATVSDKNLGLKIMQERAASIRGNLEVRTKMGQGTVVVAEVPFLL